MGEAYHVDLLNVVRQFKDGIKGCVLYGKIAREVDYPSVLRPGVALDANGLFVEIDVFAVNVGMHSAYLRDNGVYNKDGIFMVNGSVLAYIGRDGYNGSDWYQVTGTLRSPSTNRVSNCLAMLNFYRRQPNTPWSLSPCKVEDLDISNWDRHAPMYSWINASADAGVIKLPPEVMCLPRFTANDNSMAPVPKPVVPVEPEVLPQPGVVHVNRFRKENRQTLKQCGDMHKKMTDALVVSEKAKKEFISKLLKDFAVTTCPDTYLRRMLDGILQNFTSRPSQYAMTGRGVVKKYLSTNKTASEAYLGRRTVGDFLADSFRDIYPYILDNSVRVNAEGDALNLCKAMFGDKEKFYAGIAGVVLGISPDVVDDMVFFCDSHNLSITKILNENPYILQFFSSLTMDDIEKIAMCFGKHEDNSLTRYRNIVFLNAYISDTGNGSTVFTRQQLLNAVIGVKLTRMRFDKVRQGRPYLPDGTVSNVYSFLCDKNRVSLVYNPVGFQQMGGNYVRRLSNEMVKQAIDDYVSTGLGVVQDDYVTSSSLMNKELFVFNAMQQLAKKTYDYKKSDIDACIAEYEEIVGFKLEEAQVKAVHLLTNGAFVVAGSAGSGKTTVSKCVVYTLRKLDPMLEVKFAAPTGKAAKRMQEVVQEECRTLHSMFHLSTDTDNLFSTDVDSDEVCNTAFFFDESAMITVDLMYRVLQNVNAESSRIYMFGDFNQLLPIGKGLPFKNLLRFMPCVFLDVVKRAAEGSNITANSQIVNEYSDMGRWKPLRNGKDFFLFNCGGDRISDVIYGLCAHYLGRVHDNGMLARQLMLDKLPEVPGLTADDIQVVSPLTKANYPWGATALNKVLQPLFNPTRSFNKTFVYQTSQGYQPSKFVIGDRVIHTDKNMYSMQWYGSYQGGRMQKIYGQGICNGEVGRIVDFFPADKADILDEVEPIPDGFEYTDAVRRDTSWGGEKAYFIVVEYFDFISARNFYILYRAERNDSVQNNEGIVFKGEDVQRLSLFYAGTTHKLQGSQAKLVIFALNDINFSGFITRQMIYTMMTRAEKLCFGVGSVANSEYSMLTKARKDVSADDIMTIGELLV